MAMVRSLHGIKTCFVPNRGAVYRLMHITRASRFWLIDGYTAAMNKAEALEEIRRNGFDTGNGNYKAERIEWADVLSGAVLD